MLAAHSLDILAASIKVGHVVRVRNDEGIEANYDVKSEPWQLGHGQWVLGLKGIGGGYSLSRVVDWGDVCVVCRRLHRDFGLSACTACVPPNEGEIIARGEAEHLADEAARLRAALEIIAAIRDVCGSAHGVLRSNLRYADAALAGADLRDVDTVQAVAAGTWKPKS